MNAPAYLSSPYLAVARSAISTLHKVAIYHHRNALHDSELTQTRKDLCHAESLCKLLSTIAYEIPRGKKVKKPSYVGRIDRLAGPQISGFYENLDEELGRFEGFLKGQEPVRSAQALANIDCLSNGIWRRREPTSAGGELTAIFLHGGLRFLFNFQTRLVDDMRLHQPEWCGTK